MRPQSGSLRSAARRAGRRGRWSASVTGTDDYSIGRAGTLEHLGALDVVYAGIIEAQRRAVDAAEDLDPVTHDLLIAQSAELEQFHWFVRAHLEGPDGSLSTGNASTEKTAAKRARKR